jgi:hypothetical protein
MDEEDDTAVRRDATDIERRRITPDPDSAEYDLLELVAELEGCAIDDLPSFYQRVGHFVEMLYRVPPAPEAQMQLSFSYAGYRITVDQQGNVSVLNVKRSSRE